MSGNWRSQLKEVKSYGDCSGKGVLNSLCTTGPRNAQKSVTPGLSKMGEKTGWKCFWEAVRPPAPFSMSYRRGSLPHLCTGLKVHLKSCAARHSGHSAHCGFLSAWNVALLNQDVLYVWNTHRIWRLSTIKKMWNNLLIFKKIYWFHIETIVLLICWVT